MVCPSLGSQHTVSSSPFGLWINCKIKQRVQKWPENIADNIADKGEPGEPSLEPQACGLGQGGTDFHVADNRGLMRKEDKSKQHMPNSSSPIYQPEKSLYLPKRERSQLCT